MALGEARPVRIVLISGSLRARSTSSAVIAAAGALAPPGVEAVIYAEMGALPHFNPDDERDPLAPAAARLREVLGGADAVMLSTPEYAGGMPGSFKNLIDWTVGGGSLYERPVGWINPSVHGGAQDTYVSLRIVLGRAGAAIVEDACVAIPVMPEAITAAGAIGDTTVLAGIGRAMAALAAAGASSSAA